MMTFPYRYFVAAAVMLCFVAPSGNARAQVFPVCGDVDDNDVVTVTDGVQVLRAAAELSSDCTAALCDVDVSGAITVTDGVIVLRKAAGLPIKQNCIPDDGRIAPQVAHLVQRSEPLVSDALSLIVLHRAETTDKTFFCNNGSDGTYDVTYDSGEQTGDFGDCLIGNALINGSADDAGDDPILSLDIADVRSDESITFDGTDGSALLGINIEGGVKYSGRLDASPTFDQFDTGDFLLVVGNLQVPAMGYPRLGTISFVLDEDSNVPNVTGVRIFYDGSNLARVEVTFTNGSFKYYKFDLLFRNFI